MTNEIDELGGEDKFSIGTPSTGGNIVVRFKDIRSEEAIEKIDKAIQLWKNAIFLSGKAK